MLAKKEKPPLPPLFHQRSQLSLNSHQVQNFQRKLSQVSYVLNRMRSYRKTYKSSKVYSEKNSKEVNRLWRRVVAQECSPSQTFYGLLEFLQTYIFSLH